jgi:hypothetical protein
MESIDTLAKYIYNSWILREIGGQVRNGKKQQ